MAKTFWAAKATNRKPARKTALHRVRKNAVDDARYERKETAAGKFMFNLKASNGQVIGSSQSYTSASGRDNGIESVKKNAPDAKLDDQTA